MRLLQSLAKIRKPIKVTSLFHKYETDFPDLCKVYSIGTSVQGRELWVLQITQGVNDIPKLRIRFKPENGLEKLGTLKNSRFFRIKIT